MGWVPVRLDQVVDERADLVELQLRIGVRVEHRRLVDGLAVPGERGLDG